MVMLLQSLQSLHSTKVCNTYIAICCLKPNGLTTINQPRPGEKFKPKAGGRGKRDNQSDGTLPVAVADAETGADTSQPATAAPVPVQRGAIACVNFRMNDHTTPEMSNQLVLKTPRECRHLVK